MRIAIPPIISQYLNFTKNTSLAIAIGYAEMTRITFQTDRERPTRTADDLPTHGRLPDLLPDHLADRQCGQPTHATGDAMTVEAPVFEETPPQVEPARGPMDWVRKNLFNNWYNSLLTVALAAFVIWALVALVRGLLSADYEIIRANLRLFMIGAFPADQLWRPWAATYCWAVMFGVMGGSLAAGARDRASEAGLPYARTTLRQIVIRFWPILALIVVILSFTTTITPTLLTIGALVVGLGSYYLGRVLAPGCPKVDLADRRRAHRSFIYRSGRLRRSRLAGLGRAPTQSLPDLRRDPRRLPLRASPRHGPSLLAAGDPHHLGGLYRVGQRGSPDHRAHRRCLRHRFPHPQGYSTRLRHQDADRHHRLRGGLHRRGGSGRVSGGPPGSDGGSPSGGAGPVEDDAAHRPAPGSSGHHPRHGRPVHQPLQGHDAGGGPRHHRTAGSDLHRQLTNRLPGQRSLRGDP